MSRLGVDPQVPDGERDRPLQDGAVGRRVSVRRLVGTRDRRPVFTDVVGTLESLDDRHLVVLRRDGHRVDVDPRAVVAAKVLPPGPARTVSAAELEAAAALGWRAADTARLGDWLLRAEHGFTGRANSVLPLGDPGRPLDAALDDVGHWYRQRGLPGRFQVPLPLAGALDADLDRRGWVASPPVLVLVADLADLAEVAGPRPRPEDPDRLAVTVAAEPDEAWLAAYHYRGAPLPARAREVLVRGDALGFGAARGADGEVLGVGRGSVDRGWLGLTAVEVAPHARRRGLGRALLRALALWAAGHGAHAAYLQVSEDNTAGVGLYLSEGFAEHHRYHYRVAP